MKKILISLLVTLLSGSVSAWDGSGTESSPWLIKTAQDLIDLSTGSSSNDYSGKYFKVDAEVLDFTEIATDGDGSNFTPIHTFRGTFDGNGAKIKKLVINKSTTDQVGLFSELVGTVKDLTLNSDCSITGKDKVGSFAGICNYGTITGCTNAATVSGTNYVGGIIGFYSMAYSYDENKVYIDNNTNKGVITGSGDYTGGICGYSNYITTSCENQGAISGAAYTGGIVGKGEGRNCTNSGDIVATGEYTGGISGEGVCTGSTNSGNVSGTTYVGGISNHDTAGSGTYDFENNENTGEISGTNYVGGICGKGSPKESINRASVTATGLHVGGLTGYLRAKDSQNYGNVSSSNSSGITYIGGIVGNGEAYGCTNDGNVENNSTSGGVGGIAGEGSHVEDCINNGEVSGKIMIGGIAGQVPSTTGIVKNCTNNGKVTATGNQVGGIVAVSKEQSAIMGCVNKADVKGGAFVGGIVGIGGKSSGEDNNIILSGCTVEQGTITGTGDVGAIAGKLYGTNSENCKNNYYYQSVIVVKNGTTMDGSTPRGVSDSDIAEADGAVMIPISAQTINVVTADGETVKTDITTNVTNEANKEVEVISAGIPASEAGSSDVAIPATVTIGSTDYQVTSVAANTFAGKTEVTDIYLPETDTKLTLGADALKIDDTNVATIHTSLALLDDYATDAVLDQNLVAGKVQTTVTPANQYWTFACGVDVEIPDGVSVYVCKINGSEVEITELTADQLTVGGKKIIKANNGVLLSSTAGNPCKMIAVKNADITIVDATKDAKSYGADNALEPVIATNHYDPASYYMLYQGKFVAIASDDVTKTPACKALLKK